MSEKTQFKKLNDKLDRIVGTMATKNDLKTLEQNTKQDLKALEQSTKQDIKALEQSTKRDLTALEQSTKQDIKALEKSTKQGLKALEQSTKQDLKVLEQSTKQGLKALEQSTKQSISALEERMATKEEMRAVDAKVDRVIDTMVTRSEFEKLSADVTELKESVRKLMTTVDAIVKMLTDLQLEYMAIRNQMTRYDRWFKEIAEKVGIELKP